MLTVADLESPTTRPVSFDLNRGECLAVQGPSGAGKSLLLRAIADLDPSRGAVFLDSRPRADFTGPQWRRLVGYLPAEPGWWADIIGQHFTPDDTVLDLMARLRLDRSLLDKPVIQASTGERARLALIRALVNAPRILLLDEPTSALDQASAQAVETVMAERIAQGLAVVWVTHDTAQAARIAKRCLHIHPPPPSGNAS
jgi:phosphate-transporting ATPase